MLWWTLRKLKSSDCSRALNAIESLRWIKDIRVLRALGQVLLNSEHVEVRRAAATALTHFNDKNGVESLERALLSETDRSVCRIIADSMCSIQGFEDGFYSDAALLKANEYGSRATRTTAQLAYARLYELGRRRARTSRLTEMVEERDVRSLRSILLDANAPFAKRCLALECLKKSHQLIALIEILAHSDAHVDAPGLKTHEQVRLRESIEEAILSFDQNTVIDFLRPRAENRSVARLLFVRCKAEPANEIERACLAHLKDDYAALVAMQTTTAKRFVEAALARLNSGSRVLGDEKVAGPLLAAGDKRPLEGLQRLSSSSISLKAVFEQLAWANGVPEAERLLESLLNNFLSSVNSWHSEDRYYNLHTLQSGVEVAATLAAPNTVQALLMIVSEDYKYCFDPGVKKSALSALEQICQRSSGRITFRDLQMLAEKPDFVIHHKILGGWGGDPSYDETADASSIRELAAQELARRQHV